MISHGAQDTIDGVMEMIVLIARALTLACRGHQELVLENLALRQQLQAFTRASARPRLGWRDRLFWIVLAKTWQRWRTALVLASRIPWCDGIANGYAAAGRGVRRRLASVARVRTPRFVRS